jgi:3D (Asp-Asp-Asp) domain-containing protein
MKTFTDKKMALSSVAGIIFLASALVLTTSCYMPGYRNRTLKIPPNTKPVKMVVETTGYCSCGVCCSWDRNWLGQPVYKYGPNRGKRKKVGLTAVGKKATRGTIAADTSIFPFGTILHIPGYGYGVVEDRGGAIKGKHIDLFFPSHNMAKEWGRRNKTIRAWYP